MGSLISSLKHVRKWEEGEGGGHPLGGLSYLYFYHPVYFIICLVRVVISRTEFGGIQGKNIRWSSEEEKALAGPIRSCSWLAGRI